MSLVVGRRRKLVIVLVTFWLLVLGADVGFMLISGLSSLSTLLFIGIGGSLVIALTVYCIVGEKTHERKREGVNTPDTSPDAIQRQYRRSFLYFPIAVAGMSVGSIRDSLHIVAHWPGRWQDYLIPMCYLGILWGYSWMLTRRGLGTQYQAIDDELFARNRLQGQQTGFFVAIVGVIVAYLVGLRAPYWGIALLPTVSGIAIAAAGLRFALLDRAAECND